MTSTGIDLLAKLGVTLAARMIVSPSYPLLKAGSEQFRHRVNFLHTREEGRGRERETQSERPSLPQKERTTGWEWVVVRWGGADGKRTKPVNQSV